MSDGAVTSVRALVGRMRRRGPRSVMLTPLGARVGMSDDVTEYGVFARFTF